MDKDIKEAFPNNKVINLGFDDMNVNMEKILSKPPGTTVYRKIKRQNVEIAIEEGFNKLKYETIEYQNTVEDEEYNEDVVICFNNKRATDMKNNKRVHLMEPNDIALETKCENLKLKLLETFDCWSKENVNEEFSNLNDDEKLGLDDVIKYTNKDKCVASHTDKSKKFSIEQAQLSND